jgi:methylmalonyl-CoA mutase C-terminal domain/subunit
LLQGVRRTITNRGGRAKRTRDPSACASAGPKPSKRPPSTSYHFVTWSNVAGGRTWLPARCDLCHIGRMRGAAFRRTSSTRCPTLTDMAGKAPLRVVVAKPGLDGHDRGAKVVARALRDAGVEVVYTGLHQTPEQVVETAIQEDADAIGLSILSGAHMTLFRKVIDLLAERNALDITVFGGGIIPDADIPVLEQMGVAKIFTPGATTQDIVAWVHSTLEAQQPA